MKPTPSIFIALFLTILISCNHHHTKSTFEICPDNCRAKNSSTNISCKLTSAEMQKRKTTVIESLRKQVLERKETANGYTFKFAGSDKMLDELTDFIKTERECCDFFTFNLSVSGDKNEVWLELTGPPEAKNFIKTEMNL